ncbi:MAG: Uncharacterised protein [Flavobacteriia bacterium]|nr:MAG: Uncharacterised protein [Flavobacteriia bacterium]
MFGSFVLGLMAKAPACQGGEVKSPTIQTPRESVVTPVIFTRKVTSAAVGMLTQTVSLLKQLMSEEV